MSDTIANAPKISNAEIIDLTYKVNELVEKKQQLQEDLEKTEVLLKIVRQVSDTKLGTPINIKTERTYNNGTLYLITNITPTQEQQKEERSADFTANKDANTPTRVSMNLCKPTVATSSVVCPNADVAKQVAIEFVATGKFPYINKLLCKFEQDKAKQND